MKTILTLQAPRTRLFETLLLAILTYAALSLGTAQIRTGPTPALHLLATSEAPLVS